MKQTIHLTESDLKHLIKQCLFEAAGDIPAPKFNVDDPVKLVQMSNELRMPAGLHTSVAARQWNPRMNTWMYFCLYPLLDRSGWLPEDYLEAI